ncbi:MAG TPA: deoxyguanosinetriphosphate triphosphohydrolase [Candidatus Methylacidiphilales bacterium]|nr:deoxyguanosinetriphosphate triphosphohydrolase [Candidatus Methylacidiphilales bacterium]
MPRRRYDLEKTEARHLALYAQSSISSRGRVHPEDQHPFRTVFQRDRDRIVHSRSFRRLEYKTQVFLNGTGDHYRTRMTHTIEVSCIARTLARSLELNEDLAEAIALAHDLGHPPFGHLGEETLDCLMAKHGGFRHNAQSLRVVEELELKYPEFNGLNLTWEVREGLHKPYPPHVLGEGFIQPSLEAQAVDLADQVAYICHDLDDGLDSGLIKEEELEALELWRATRHEALSPYPHLEPERGRYYVLRCLLGRLADDIITYSGRAIRERSPQTSDETRRLQALITFSPETAKLARELLKFLYERFYYHPDLLALRQRSVDCLNQLFDLLVGHPHLLSPQFEKRLKKDGVHRAVCDYLACLTDRQVYTQYRKFIGGPASLEISRLEQPALL